MRLQPTGWQCWSAGCFFSSMPLLWIFLVRPATMVSKLPIGWTLQGVRYGVSCSPYASSPPNHNTPCGSDGRSVRHYPSTMTPCVSLPPGSSRSVCGYFSMCLDKRGRQMRSADHGLSLSLDSSLEVSTAPSDLLQATGILSSSGIGTCLGL
jgi:hypothetical protein